MAKRINFGSSSLSPHFSGLFKQFGRWLVERRGLHFTATHIHKYFPYFLSLDKLAIDTGRLPTYKEIVDKLTVAATRQTLLVTKFLDQCGIIKVEKAVQEYYSNVDTINRYLQTFEEGSFFNESLNTYHETLLLKLAAGKTSIRSIRLALTPAVKLLKTCQYIGGTQPDNLLLQSILQAYPGQNASITGFINFLNSKYQCKLTMRHTSEPVIKRNSSSAKQLRRILIKLLRNQESNESSRSHLLGTALCYFHGMNIPPYLLTTTDMLKKDKIGNHYVSYAGHKLYLPENIARQIKHC